MSENTASSSQEPEGSGRPANLRRAAVTAAVLVPLGVAGWLVWSATGGSGGGGQPVAKPSAAEASQRAGRDGNSAEGPEPLRGKTVLIDPGHNPNNREHPEEIARTVDIGTDSKVCDNTGTDTEAGYAEAEFTLDLARRVRRGLQEQGAQVKFTHDGKRPYGPCVDERAELGNRAKADAVVSLHADGAPAGSRGFHVIVPTAVKEGKADTTGIVGPSRRLGRHLVRSFEEATGTSPASYINDGSGLDGRDDLGGLNLSTVPKVFLECGNMRDARDARLLTDAGWRDRAAQGVVGGIASFLLGKE